MVLWLNDPRHDRAWEDFEHTLRTGQPCVEKTWGKPVFEWLQAVPELAAIFNDAMSGNAANTHAAVLEAYDFAGISTLVDVGGGHGSLMSRILQRHPRIRGTVFDQPHVVAGARANVGPGCELIGGDFFQSLPAADAHIMSFILHDWDDQRATRILRNCHAATGRILVVEVVLPEGNAPSLGKLIDMEMLAFTGGLERTEKEYRALFESAGFRLERVIPTHSPCSLLEAVRA
jgi:O-methyltransferase domain